MQHGICSHRNAGSTLRFRRRHGVRHVYISQKSTCFERRCLHSVSSANRSLRAIQIDEIFVDKPLPARRQRLITNSRLLSDWRRRDERCFGGCRLLVWCVWHVSESNTGD